MTFKKRYIIILSAVTIILSAILYAAGAYCNVSSLAGEKLNGEIAALHESTAELNAAKADLSQQISDIDLEIEINDADSNEYIEYQKKNEELNASISELREHSQELDKQLEQKNSSSSQNHTQTTGKTYTLKKDEYYTCPEKIPAGKYRATGSGTIRIYAENGKVKTNEDLDVAPDNTFTFPLEENQKIAVSGEVTLTELK